MNKEKIKQAHDLLFESIKLLIEVNDPELYPIMIKMTDTQQDLFGYLFDLNWDDNKTDEENAITLKNLGIIN